MPGLAPDAPAYSSDRRTVLEGIDREEGGRRREAWASILRRIACASSCGSLRNLQHLPRLDLVRIGELILVGLEDLHVGVGVAEMRLGDGAQACRPTSPCRSWLRPPPRRGPPTTLMSATMSLRQSGMVLMAFQISLFSASVFTDADEVQLAVFFLRAAVELTLRRLRWRRRMYRVNPSSHLRALRVTASHIPELVHGRIYCRWPNCVWPRSRAMPEVASPSDPAPRRGSRRHADKCTPSSWA